MAEFIELYKSGEGEENLDNSSAKRVWALVGENDPAAVRSICDASIPTFYLGLTLASYFPRPLGNGLWDVTATYGTQKLSNLGDVLTSFDTTGGTRHITQSLETVAAYAAPGFTASVTDFNGAINVDNGNVNGCDIPGPGTFNFQITKKWPIALFDQAKIVALAGMTFKTNNNIFYDFEAGTLLFLGASGSQRGLEAWEVTYHFAFSENVTGLSVGGITGIAKKGWQYLWFAYVRNESNQRRVIRPCAAYVERVCEEADYLSLGL